VANFFPLRPGSWQISFHFRCFHGNALSSANQVPKNLILEYPSIFEIPDHWREKKSAPHKAGMATAGTGAVSIDAPHNGASLQ